MDPTIFVGVLSFLASILGTFSGVLISGKLTNYRLEQLELKVEKHNNLIERTYILEEKMRVANHRISDLEHQEAVL